MTNLELCDRSIYELDNLRKQGEVSTEEIARSVLKRIEQVESQVHAYILLTTDSVLAAAQQADQQLKNGSLPSPLAGMPIALKDVFSTKGMQTSCGSKILQNFIAPYDATVTTCLKKAGMNLVGKANMDEFAMGSSTEHSAFGPSHNPWDLTRTPGGSSGGSAAAVAAGEALAAVGTDTGGSVRQPSALTGLVGLKPTYGRVSRYGMVAFASSLDTAGVLARSVMDAALLLKIIAGYDVLDSTSVKEPVPDYPAMLSNANLKGKRIGVVKELEAQQETDPEVRENFKQSIKLLKSLGAEVCQLSLPHLKFALPIYYIIAPSEASSNLGRYDGIRYGMRSQEAKGLRGLYSRTREAGFGKEVKRRIMLGCFALSSGWYDAYYGKASALRRCLQADFAKAFETVELIASPTTPTAAFPLGSIQTPLQMYMQDVFTLPANLVGLPGISLPSGFTSSKLPLGLQLLAQHFQEGALLQAAHVFCETAGFQHQRPPLNRL